MIALYGQGASRAGNRLALAVGVAPVQMLYACGIMFFFSAALHIAASLHWPAELTRRQDSCLWRPRFWREVTAELAAPPRWQNYRLLSGLVSHF